MRAMPRRPASLQILGKGRRRAASRRAASSRATGPREAAMGTGPREAAATRGSPTTSVPAGHRRLHGSTSHLPPLPPPIVSTNTNIVAPDPIPRRTKLQRLYNSTICHQVCRNGVYCGLVAGQANAKLRMRGDSNLPQQKLSNKSRGNAEKRRNADR